MLILALMFLVVIGLAIYQYSLQKGFMQNIFNKYKYSATISNVYRVGLGENSSKNATVVVNEGEKEIKISSLAYDSDYDFGTGSFSVSLWAKFPVKATEDTYVLFSRYSGAWATIAVALKPAVVDPNEHLQLTGSLSIAAYINPESTSAATKFNIAGKWDGSNESYLLAQYGYEIRMYIDSSSSYVTTNSANLATGTWYYVVGVYDSINQTVKIYINGVEYETTITGSIPSAIGTDAGSFSIGAEDTSSTPANFYDGKIDEMRLYNINLNPKQVRALYNYASGPVGYWDLNEKSGTTTIYDKSGNGNNGTMNGSMTESDWVNGKFGSALDFDGSNDNVTVADTSVHDITSAITVQGWVRYNAVPTSGYYKIIGKCNETGNQRSYAVGHTNDSPVFYLSPDGTRTGTCNATGKATFVTNTWYYYAGI